MAKTTKLKISGMTCQSCVKLIEQRVAKLKGVKKVKVDLVKETATVTGTAKKADIAAAIQKMGFGVDGKKAKPQGFWQGLAYGIIPHIGCIAFIIGSVFGVTLLMQFFKPVLMNRWFFHFLVAFSFLAATVGSALYLRSNGLLSWQGMKRKKGYLATMYGATIGINLALFLLIFPLLANVQVVSASSATGLAAGSSNLASLTMEVDIPCPGHAPLISNELKGVPGVAEIKYSFPETFQVYYDGESSTKEAMLALEVFDEYPATVTNDGSPAASLAPVAKSYGAGSSCSGSCGGSCGRPTCGCGG